MLQLFHWLFNDADFSRNLLQFSLRVGAECQNFNDGTLNILIFLYSFNDVCDFISIFKTL